MQTLSEFYRLMTNTGTLRRALVDSYLAGAGTREDVAGLRAALESLEALRGEDGACWFLTKRGGKPTSVRIDYETQELEKDLIFFEHGESSLVSYIAGRSSKLKLQVDAVKNLLSPVRNAAFITDRDGTVNNYCGRYRSSVQSAYNAIHLTRFARVRTNNAVILTSAPLENFGLLDLSVVPAQTFLMAGSKGREFRDVDGRKHSLPLESVKQERLDALNSRIIQLLESPEYEEFALIGSAVQFKLGQTTVARQDLHGSITAERSQGFLQRIRALVSEVDPRGEVFRIEDTGYDIEIIATREEGDRDFNKGDGIVFVDRIAGLDMNGPTVVCGDTASDVPMVEAVSQTSSDLRVVFVTQSDELKKQVSELAAQSVFVDHPDALVIALGELGKE